MTQDSISPRMAELKRLGVVYEAGEKVCGVTGKTVIAWDVTDKLPSKDDVPPPHRDEAAALREALKPFAGLWDPNTRRVIFPQISRTVTTDNVRRAHEALHL